MKTLMIDDHPLVLSALRAVMEGFGEDVEVVTASSAAEARTRLACDNGFDLVLLDLQLGDADGFEFLVELRAAHPALPVVVVSAFDHNDDVCRAIDLGAMGYVPKRASNEALQDALRAVMSGNIYVPSMTIRSDAASRAVQPHAFDARAGGATGSNSWGLRGASAAAPSRPLSDLKLTPRQTDVLGLLLKGQPNKLIARELNLSVETVKDHVAAVLRSLNVSSRTQAVVAVSRMAEQGARIPWRESRHG